MKQTTILLSVLCCLFFSQSLLAQSIPQGMRYQAVARDLTGQPLSRQYISLLIGIRSDDANGALVYEETHHVTTDNGGQFAITIGGGRARQGNFETIPWGSNEMWLTVALDVQGADHFKALTASQLWTVPYAFHAGTAETLTAMGSSNQGKGCGATGIPFWTNLGNTNVSDTCHFIGTVHAVDFIMKTNNIERMRITKDGKIVMTGLLEVENLFVSNDAEIGHNLLVDNDAQVKNNLAVDKELRIGSRVIVNGGVSGSDQNINNYPVLVQGSNQGIAIRVNGSRSTANNFLSFWDVSGGMHGRIEGQTKDEVMNSFNYIWETTMSALQVGFLAGEAACASGQLDLCEAALLAAQAIELGLEWGKFTDEMVSNAGVAYESGNGDYAEWLEKAIPAETFHFGEVVGVRGGKISKKTNGADHNMVVSKNPIVLGNMPPAERQKDFEKIAFMGQVPVRVVGKVAVGDYLLASGRNDGLAIAQRPDQMRTEDYTRIVGVAWEASDNPLGGLVNTAIGINTNDVAMRMVQQQRELDMLKQQMNQLYAHLGLPVPNALQTTAAASQPLGNPGPTPSEPLTNSISQAQVNKWLDDNRLFFETCMNQTQTQLELQGADISQYPEIAAIYANPVGFLKEQYAKGYWEGMFSKLLK